MNNKGQSLVSFVLILPLLVFFIAFFIDSSKSIMEKERIDGIVYSNLEMILNKDIKDVNKIIDVLKENENDLEINVLINEDDIMLNASVKKRNLFDNIFKMKWYNLEFNYCGSYQNKKIKKNCG